MKLASPSFALCDLSNGLSEMTIFPKCKIAAHILNMSNCSSSENPRVFKA